MQLDCSTNHIYFFFLENNVIVENTGKKTRVSIKYPTLTNYYKDRKSTLKIIAENADKLQAWSFAMKHWMYYTHTHTHIL